MRKLFFLLILIVLCFVLYSENFIPDKIAYTDRDGYIVETDEYACTLFEGTTPEGDISHKWIGNSSYGECFIQFEIPEPEQEDKLVRVNQMELFLFNGEKRSYSYSISHSDTWSMNSSDFSTIVDDHVVTQSSGSLKIEFDTITNAKCFRVKLQGVDYPLVELYEIYVRYAPYQVRLPNTNSEFYMGQESALIQWESFPPFSEPDNFPKRIELYKDGQYLLNVENSVSDWGEFQWAVVPELEQGDSYQIQIVDLGGEGEILSDYFRISEAGVNLTPIPVGTPEALPGYNCTVSFSYLETRKNRNLVLRINGFGFENYNEQHDLSLLLEKKNDPGKDFPMVICGSWFIDNAVITNNSKYEWEIPELPISGDASDYRVIVRNNQHPEYYGESRDFTIMSPEKLTPLGDVDGDYDITIIDSLLIASHYVGLSVDINEAEADVDCSGDINIVDALNVAQAYVGILELPYVCGESEAGGYSIAIEEDFSEICVFKPEFETDITLKLGDYPVTDYKINVYFDTFLIGPDIFKGNYGVEGFGILSVEDNNGMLTITGHSEEGIDREDLLRINWMVNGELRDVSDLIRVEVESMVNSHEDNIVLPMISKPYRMIPAEVCKIFLNNDKYEVRPGDSLTTTLSWEVPEGRKIAAFGFCIYYDPTQLAVDTEFSRFGVVQLNDDFVGAETIPELGELNISRWYVNGINSGDFLEIHWKILQFSDKKGINEIEIIVNSLLDPYANPIDIASDNCKSAEYKYNAFIRPDVQINIINNKQELESSEDLITTVSWETNNNQLVAAYGFIIYYDETLLELNTSIGRSGIVDLNENFPVAGISNSNPGVLYLSGFYIEGVGTSDMIEIHWKARSTSGFGTIKLFVDNITSSSAHSLSSNSEEILSEEYVINSDSLNKIILENNTDQIAIGEEFKTTLSWEIQDSQFVGAYGLIVSYNSDNIIPNSTIGNNGVVNLNENFPVNEVRILEPGKLLLQGVILASTGSFNILEIHWQVLTQPSVGTINVVIDNLIDPSASLLDLSNFKIQPATYEISNQALAKVNIRNDKKRLAINENLTSTISCIFDNDQTGTHFQYLIKYDYEQLNLDESEYQNGLSIIEDSLVITQEMVELGTFRITGSDPEGVGTGDLFEIHWTSLNKSGFGDIEIEVEGFSTLAEGEVYPGRVVAEGGHYEVTNPVLPAVMIRNDKQQVAMQKELVTTIGWQLLPWQSVAAYSFNIRYDSELIEIDASVFDNGVENIYTQPIVEINEPGYLKILNFGLESWKSMNIAKLHWKALTKLGIGNITLEVDYFVQPDATSIALNNTTVNTNQFEIVPPLHTVALKTDKNVINIGDNLKTTISWEMDNEELCAAFGFRINYDQTQLSLDTESGSNGIVWVNDYFGGLVNNTEPGILNIEGFYPDGLNSGDIIEINWKAIDSGTGEMSLEIEQLFNSNAVDLMPATGIQCNSSYYILSP